MVFLPSIVFAATDSTHSILPNIKSFSLDNGLRLMVIENHRAPIVIHSVNYFVGSMDEQLDDKGITHLLEHMMFRGTENYSEKEIEDLLQSVGGLSNASTSRDITRYFQYVQPQNLGKVMALEAERMQLLRIDPQHFNAEKKVVAEERNQRISNSKRRLSSEEVFGLVMRNHPYRVPITGYHRDIENLNLENTLAFYKKFYRPNNTLVSIIGNITWQEALELTQKYYGNLKNPPEDSAYGTTPSQDRTVFEPPQQGQISHILYDEKAASVSVLLMWKTPSFRSLSQKFHPKDFRYKPTTSDDKLKHPFLPFILSLLIFEEIISDESGSTYQSLVNQEKFANAFGASFNPWVRGPGIFYLYLNAADKEQTPENIQKRLLKAVSYTESLINDKNVANAKQSIVSGLAYTIDSIGRLSYFIKDLFIGNISPEELNAIIYESLLKLDPETIKQNVDKLLQQNYVLSSTLPT